MKGARSPKVLFMQLDGPRTDAHGRDELAPRSARATLCTCTHRRSRSLCGNSAMGSSCASIASSLVPTLDLKRNAGYLSSVRRHVRSFAKLVTLAFGLSAFAPFLLCGGGFPTKAEASACCRAMQFQCHKTNGDSACCKHQSVAPVPPGITSASQVSPSRPLATVGVLPVAVTARSLASHFGQRLFDLFPAHSPPGSVPLFLFHLILLI